MSKKPSLLWCQAEGKPDEEVVKFPIFSLAVVSYRGRYQTAAKISVPYNKDLVLTHDARFSRTGWGFCSMVALCRDPGEGAAAVQHTAFHPGGWGEARDSKHSGSYMSWLPTQKRSISFPLTGSPS